MDLFTYLMAKSGSNSSVHGDLFSYLLGKGQSQIQTISGVTIYIPDAKKTKILELIMDKESTQNTTTGKNLLNTLTFRDNNLNVYVKNNVKAIINRDGTITLDGTATANTDFYINIQTIDGTDKKIVIVGMSGTFTGNTSFYAYDSNYSNSKNASITGLTTATSSLTNNDYVYFEIYVRSGNVYNNTKFGLMVVDTSESDLSYESYSGGQPSPSPSFPQEVNTVKGYKNLIGSDTQQYRVNLKGGDKITLYNNSNSNITVNTYSNYGDITRNDFWISNPGIYRTITLAYDTQAIAWDTEPDTNYKYMITYGDEILPYVDYGNNYISFNVNDGDTTIQTPIPLNNNELVGIGDYKDELIVDKGGNVYINKKTKKYVFDGTEEWKLENLSSSRKNFYLTDLERGQRFQGMLNNIGRYNTSLVNNYDCFIYNTTLNFLCNEYNNTTDFKNMLSSQNMVVYYVLVTPQLIDLNTKVDIKLFKGANTITNSEDCNMTIQYY